MVSAVLHVAASRVNYIYIYQGVVMQVEMNGEIIVGIAIMLIGIMAIGLAIYYIRKGREERARNNEGDSSNRVPSAADMDK